MMRRWMGIVTILALMPMLMACRSMDEDLLQAAFKGDQKQVQALLEKGAAVNAPPRSTAARPCSSPPRTAIGRLWRCC